MRAIVLTNFRLVNTFLRQISKQVVQKNQRSRYYADSAIHEAHNAVQKVLQEERTLSTSSLPNSWTNAKYNPGNAPGNQGL